MVITAFKNRFYVLERQYDILSYVALKAIKANHVQILCIVLYHD